MITFFTFNIKQIDDNGETKTAGLNLTNIGHVDRVIITPVLPTIL